MPVDRAMTSHRSALPSPHRPGRWLAAAAGTAAALAACAWFVQRQTRRAERAFPPTGRFVNVQGVRLHFTVHGRDDAPQTLVMLHGNGSLGTELELSGLVRQASERYRVVVFDRPGYGHSERPVGLRFGPQEQADLFHAAWVRLGVDQPIVFGHSWGALVAMAMGLRHPDDVGALVLASGYYFPSMRLDVPVRSAPAVPLLGRLMRHTVSPLLGRLLWPLSVRRMFAPAAPTEAFRRRYPVWMSLRPASLEASAFESATMIPSARLLKDRYAQLKVPAVLIAGAEDRLQSTRWHSARLHDQLEVSWLRVVEDAGHLVHHVATGQVMASIDQAAAMVWDRALLLRTASGLKAGDAAADPVPLRESA
jgi:pimeloyl-ACP methyl ester carboxylesterase